MKRNAWFGSGALVAAVAAAALLAGCSDKIKSVLVIPNALPKVTITRAPIDTTVVCEPDPVRSCYSLTIQWVGYDPDGRVDHYLYAIDPSPGDTTWRLTRNNEERLIFPSTRALPFGTNETPKARDFHIFVIKAVDNQGAAGPTVARAFFSFTEAPSVVISNPSPSSLLTPRLTPSVRINWTGSDNDGVFNSKPVKYKYTLLNPSSRFTPDSAALNPNRLRDLYAPHFFGWDSTSGETTTVQYTSLSPNQTYMFVIVAFDEAGAYSPIFDLNTNMLRFTVAIAGNEGPQITAFNEFFNYTWRKGYCPCPTTEFFIEVPAGQEVTFNWTAQAPEGAAMRGYRWALDIDDVADSTTRTDERDPSQYHRWSTWSLHTQSVSLGPFAGTLPPDPPEEHWFYIEAIDNVGLKNLAIIRFQVVRAQLNPGRLLVVKDTRFITDDADRNNPGCVARPLQIWPTQAEFDTFMFARGGKPWRCYPGTPLTSPGLFSAYWPDTQGTRFQRKDLTVRLSKLSLYEFVVWMVDGTGSTYERVGDDLLRPQTSLYYMTGPGRFNTLAAYIKQGGKAWVAGGGAAMASNWQWNDRGNDQPTITFSHLSQRKDLNPGRFMYDLARWQSEIRIAKVPVNPTRFLGRFESRPHPDAGHYTRFASELPSRLELRTAATDPLPPHRTDPGRYYHTTTNLEFLQVENRILENVSTDPERPNEVSTLDTLFKASGGGLPLPNQNPHNVIMTYYHGPTVPHGMVFSGFSLWDFKTHQCKAVIDFVLRRIWGLQPRASLRAASLETARPARAAGAPRRGAGGDPLDRSWSGPAAAGKTVRRTD